jgi:polysaccharide export outer membrane protein
MRGSSFFGESNGEAQAKGGLFRAMKVVVLISWSALVGLVGCSGLPTSGPTTSEVVGQVVKNGQPRFNLVEVDHRVVDALAVPPQQGFAAAFGGSGKPPSPTIGIGDTVSVSIWQSAGVGPGLLGGALSGTPTTQAPGGQVVIVPEQVVAADGGISVPYAGRARAAGRTPFQVQQAIENLLGQFAIKPQVIVTLTKTVSDKVTVSGDIVNGVRHSLSFRGERLLDVIAAAGGPKSPLYETTVQLSRGGATVSIPMERLVSIPSENIYAWPDDVITVVRVPQTFLVFGATTNNAQLPFGASQLTLAQAIAKAGGLVDTRADPTGVFVFRFEQGSVAAALGAPALRDGRSPTLYHLNLQDPDGYFLASRFPVHNDDIIYVANAATNQLSKFLTLIGNLTQPVFSGVIVLKSLQP